MTLLAAIDLRQYCIINYANAKACDITSFNWTAFIPFLIAMKTGSEVCELLSTMAQIITKSIILELLASRMSGSGG
jgi:hypothetical protein